MPPSTRLYAWEGIDASGARQHGQQPGRSPAFVQAWLQRQGIRATRVRLAGGLRWRWPRRAGKADAPGFSRQLATLLTAGVPLLQAFEVMARSTVDSGMAALLARLKQDVAAGLGL
ncbi:type II secretion system F family protein, partial [Pseudomonas mosselii]|uniref:type II secretion system F family protein n=1 Tax=Pseudomonas mosselii TaxID=78327 RepID=UPI0016480061